MIYIFFEYNYNPMTGSPARRWLYIISIVIFSFCLLFYPIFLLFSPLIIILSLSLPLFSLPFPFLFFLYFLSILPSSLFYHSFIFTSSFPRRKSTKCHIINPLTQPPPIYKPRTSSHVIKSPCVQIRTCADCTEMIRNVDSARVVFAGLFTSCNIQLIH